MLCSRCLVPTYCTTCNTTSAGRDQIFHGLDTKWEGNSDSLTWTGHTAGKVWPVVTQPAKCGQWSHSRQSVASGHTAGKVWPVVTQPAKCGQWSHSRQSVASGHTAGKVWPVVTQPAKCGQWSHSRQSVASGHTAGKV